MNGKYPVNPEKSCQSCLPLLCAKPAQRYASDEHRTFADSPKEKLKCFRLHPASFFQSYCWSE